METKVKKKQKRGRLCKRHKSSKAIKTKEEKTLGKSPKATSVFSLPPEAWVLNVFEFLEPKDLCNISKVCRYFYVLSTDNYVWRMRYQRYWGVSSFDYECKALAWLKMKVPEQKVYFKSKDHIFWKQRFGFRARFGDEKIIVRIQYDNGTSFKTLMCTKSDLAGEVCHRMATYSTSYRLGSKLYKTLLENGTLHYTEELDYLINDHSSFQLFQPQSDDQEQGRWLSPIDTLGLYTGDKTHFALAQYYDSLNLLQLEFQTRIRPLKYTVNVNNVCVTRTVLIDCCWDIRQIIHVILIQMHPQIQYKASRDRESYRLVWRPPGQVLKLDQNLHEQGINLVEAGPQPEFYLVRESEMSAE